MLFITPSSYNIETMKRLSKESLTNATVSMPEWSLTTAAMLLATTYPDEAQAFMCNIAHTTMLLEAISGVYTVIPCAKPLRRNLCLR